MKRWLIPVVAVVVIAVGVGCFFAGKAVGGGGTPTLAEAMKVIQSQAGNGANGATGGSVPSFGQRGANGGGGLVSGSIIAADSTSITVKESSGSTKIVLFGKSATITKSDTGSTSDLVVGKEVTVNGTSNSDGSVTASRISIGKIFSGAAPGGITTTTAATN
jgi:hypothetical protein